MEEQNQNSPISKLLVSYCIKLYCYYILAFWGIPPKLQHGDVASFEKNPTEIEDTAEFEAHDGISDGIHQSVACYTFEDLAVK